MRILAHHSRETLAAGLNEAVIGSSETCTVEVAEALPVHARIRLHEIEAVGPCFVGGLFLAAGKRRRLVPGAEIQIGRTRLIVETEQPSLEGVSTRRIALDMESAPTLIAIEGPCKGTELSLPISAPLVFGRRKEPGRVVIDDPSVSRDHAEVMLDGATVLVRDLYSGRGTRLGRHPISPGRRAIWEPGKMLQIGDAIFALRVPDWVRNADLLDEEPNADDASAEAEPPLTASEDAQGGGATPTVLADAPEQAEAPRATAMGPVARSELPASDRAIRGFLIVMVILAASVVVLLVYWLATASYSGGEQTWTTQTLRFGLRSEQKIGR